MNGSSGKVFWLAGLAMLGVTIGACDGGEPIELKASALNPWLAVPGLPAGMDCGLSYSNSFNVGVEFETCRGARTLSGEATENFMNRSIGDRGLPSGRGFRAQATHGSGQASAATSDRLAILPGTVCGFKENCNNAGDMCLGHNPIISCPKGWIQHISGDALAPNGCVFAWCSYADPNQICCDGTTCDPACSNNMPQGTTCGLGDFRRSDGICKTSEVLAVGCPAGFHRSSGNYDFGRPAGNGLYWCTKN